MVTASGPEDVPNKMDVISSPSPSIGDVEKQDSTSQDAAVEPTKNDPNVVGWDGDDDPECPLNWTGNKKWLNGGLLAAMTFVT